MGRTNKSIRMAAARMQAECDEWNGRNPIGTSVMLKKDGIDEPVEARTKSEAQILSGHSVVIWLEGVSGCYLLSHVRPASTPGQRAYASADLKRKLLPA